MSPVLQREMETVWEEGWGMGECQGNATPSTTQGRRKKSAQMAVLLETSLVWGFCND